MTSRHETPAQSSARRERAEAVAALHAMQAARPLKPPPFNFAPLRESAAARALREDQRAGIW